MSVFLVLYAALFVVLACVLIYMSTRGSAKSAQPVAESPAPEIKPPAEAQKTPAPAAAAAPPAEVDVPQKLVDVRAVAEEWRAAHTDATEVEAFAHTKAMRVEAGMDERLGSKLRAAKQRGLTAQNTVTAVQKMLVADPPAAGSWETYLQEKMQDRTRSKKGTPFLRCQDGMYTSEYQKLLGATKGGAARAAAIA
jgi:hypothetical protein